MHEILQRNFSCGARLMLQLSPMLDLLNFCAAKESNFTAFDHRADLLISIEVVLGFFHCRTDQNKPKTRKPTSNTLKPASFDVQTQNRFRLEVFFLFLAF
jgi:hypothetical protein